MIKVNLLPTKKKKKAKKIPFFIISTILVTLATVAVCAFVWIHFNNEVDKRKKTIRDNEKLIAELKEKVKEVEAYEAKNKLYAQRRDILEQIGKDKTVPAKVMDELGNTLPAGVWFTNFELKGRAASLDCIAFSNSDVVTYINNLKNSKIFTDVYLLESVQTKISSYTLYKFRVTFTVTA